MGALAKKLTEFRRQEQEMRGYAASSRWYTGLSNAIHFLERAEGEGDYLDRFRDAWSAAYNLFMMHGKAGDDEHKCFNRWVTALKEVPSVRRFFSESHETAPFSAFKANVKKAQKTLLKLQGQQELYAWDAKPTSADKACRYFLTICRDIRNTCSHPDFNPKAAAIKKALTSAADCLVPVVAAAIWGTIEHPVEGTTGRTTAYRSFLWPFLKNSDSFFSDYYLEKLFPEEELEAFTEDVARTSLKAIARQIASMRSNLINADADETREKWCKQVLFPVLGATLKEGVRIVTEDGVSQPTFVLPVADLKGGPRTEYHGKDAGRDLACLTWVLPWKTSLDSVAIDPEFKNLPVIEMAHKVLNLSDVPWAVLTNGRKLRLLSKRTAHKPRCFLEIDLQALVDRRGDAEARQAFRYFLGLFSVGSFTEKDDQDNTRLDRVLTGSERHGKEIGDELKQNVFKALEELGDGFLHYLRSISPDELDMWRKEKASSLSLEEYLASDQLLTEIYHESLSLMYRLLFLFYAESLNLLPMDDEMYRETYSLESIRDDIISIHDDPDTKRFFGKGHADLWDRLEELFVFVNKGWRNVIPAYNGGLFDPDLHEFLERFKVDDYHLARAIDLLSRTKPRAGQARGEGRKKVTYRDMDIRHLGSIYEGILEYMAQIAGQDLVVLKRGSGNKVYEEYVPVSELKNKEKEQFKSWREAKEENPENPKPPRGCRIMGEKTYGQYFLVYGGRESKRKSSGSYYTPDYIVQYIVENTLGPLVRGECRPKPEPLSEELKKLGIKDEPSPTGRLTSDEILELKVLDPAMGSGHFLVAATEYIARAYGEAIIREGKDEEGVISDDEFIRYKRIVAERCIYGVDINPVAVELAKLSMWLFTMDKGRPLSFLDHHLKYGNSLIGAWIKDLGVLPEFDKKGRPKKVEPEKVPATQMNLFETRLKEKLPLMIRDLLGIMKSETLTPDDIKLKKGLDKAVTDIKRPFKNIADAWVGTYFGDEVRDYERLLSNVAVANDRQSKAADEHRFFHWELEFPEVWFDTRGSRKSRAGFSATIGNPPYLAFHEGTDQQKNFYKPKYYSAIGKYDHYILFSEQSLKLTAEPSLHSFIIPNKFIRSQYGAAFKKMSLNYCSLISLVDFGDLQIFPGVTNYPCIYILKKPPFSMASTKFYKILCSPRNALEKIPATSSTTEIHFHEHSGFKSTWSPMSNLMHENLQKIDNPTLTLKLKNIADGIFQGVRIGLQEAFKVSKSDILNENLENEIIQLAIGGKDIDAFFVRPPKSITTACHIIYPYNVEKRELVNITEYPNCQRWLMRYYNKLLERRDSGRSISESRKCWWEYWDPCFKMLQKRIVTPDISKQNEFALADHSILSLNTVYSIVFSTSKLSYEATIAILNSSVVEYFIHSISPCLRGNYYRYKTKYLEQIPIPRFLLSNEGSLNHKVASFDYSENQEELFQLCRNFAELGDRTRSLFILEDLYKRKVERGELVNDLIDAAACGFYQLSSFQSVQ